MFMVKPSSKPGFWRRFRRAESGAAAVEFGLVALPFFMLMWAIIELGMVFFVDVTLDNAVGRMSRQIRTGEFQSAGGTAETFKSAVCSRMLWLESGCSSVLRVDVRTFELFADVKDAPPPTTDPESGDPEFNSANNCFQTGGPTNIVLVRAFYEWTLFTPLLDNSLVNLGNNKRLLTAATIFRNEPYGPATEPPSC
ncbi:MAG TPA: TadE/TadG family type IV pilus assembly protein [Phenylobacterium sp.]|nr:TadE/TadG family type IV pilus assembly protein [Phenylobacterium sp.]